MTLVQPQVVTDMRPVQLIVATALGMTLVQLQLVMATVLGMPLEGRHVEEEVDSVGELEEHEGAHGVEGDRQEDVGELEVGEGDLQEDVVLWEHHGDGVLNDLSHTQLDINQIK